MKQDKTKQEEGIVEKDPDEEYEKYRDEKILNKHN